MYSQFMMYGQKNIKLQFNISIYPGLLLCLKNALYCDSDSGLNTF